MSIKYELTGKVLGVFISADAQSLITKRQRQVKVSLAGFEGDKHSGMTRLSDTRMLGYYPRGVEIRNDRQVSIVSVEEIEQIAAAMGVPEILPEWLGANLLFRDIPRLTQLPPSTRLSFSHGAVLVVQKENLPCIHPGKVIQAYYSRQGLDSLFPKASFHQRGVVACVEKPGVIGEGDEVRVEVPEQIVYTMNESKNLG
ncbi:MAG: MOSC domain-containing protein [Acidobacteriota bacterium]